jgi:hypothetical protein
MNVSVVSFHIGPASSITTFAPACASTMAAMPPPAPDPMTQTSYAVRLRMICMAVIITPSTASTRGNAVPVTPST